MARSSVSVKAETRRGLQVHKTQRRLRDHSPQYPVPSGDAERQFALFLLPLHRRGGGEFLTCFGVPLDCLKSQLGPFERAH